MRSACREYGTVGVHSLASQRTRRDIRINIQLNCGVRVPGFFRSATAFSVERQLRFFALK